jgi:hypothetical protein
VEIYDCQLAGNFPVSTISAEDRAKVDAGAYGPAPKGEKKRQNMLTYQDYQQEYENVEKFTLTCENDNDFDSTTVKKRQKQETNLQYFHPMSVQVTTSDSKSSKPTTTTTTDCPNADGTINTATTTTVIFKPVSLSSNADTINTVTAL